MKILAIETSCDDTGIAILSENKKKLTVLSNIVSSQQIHSNYGGVFPMMAKREHQRNLVPVLEQALKLAKLLKITNHKSQIPNKFQTVKKILEKENTLFENTKDFLEKYEKPDIDAIAVTHGPGLEPCLYVGVNFAKALSHAWGIPVIPVNHIEAHILVNFLENPKIELPAVSLVVSGGHTQLILVKKIGNYQIIGETRDDAAGECFDKAARILGLGYPGGPIISKIASEFGGRRTSPKIVLPRPMIHSKDYNFSFSGLKTSVLYRVRDELKDRPVDQSTVLNKKFVSEMCFAVQDAICDVLIKKTINSAKAYKAKTIILGGGVSANSELRSQFEFKIKNEKLKMNLVFPPPALSTDNGLMIAVAGYFNKAKKIAPPSHKASGGAVGQKLSVNANLRIG
ncbi:MAG: tRNA (adenosine(37)-N6)-threonylcarbamoyltransferase complex transferase subunit TsaD [Candidatus Staskawiczbacteria bacterium]|nr:tRNA (adenosine(37)-N6)-threonylcarbamoyltransferase complex transferase subunit TsaD [Candidatus Staskawiczbacteria bacterium]